MPLRAHGRSPRNGLRSSRASSNTDYHLGPNHLYKDPRSCGFDGATDGKPYDLRVWSGWRDSNPRPPAPKAGALTKLRYIPCAAPCARPGGTTRGPTCASVRESTWLTDSPRHRRALPRAAPERAAVLPPRPAERIRQVTRPGIAKTEIASGEFGPAHNRSVQLYSALTRRPVIGTVHNVIPLRVLD
jgi:hypothetical protein